MWEESKPGVITCRPQTAGESGRARFCFHTARARPGPTMAGPTAPPVPHRLVYKVGVEWPLRQG